MKMRLAWLCRPCCRSSTIAPSCPGVWSRPTCTASTVTCTASTTCDSLAQCRLQSQRVPVNSSSCSSSTAMAASNSNMWTSSERIYGVWSTIAMPSNSASRGCWPAAISTVFLPREEPRPLAENESLQPCVPIELSFLLVSLIFFDFYGWVPIFYNTLMNLIIENRLINLLELHERWCFIAIYRTDYSDFLVMGHHT